MNIPGFDKLFARWMHRKPVSTLAARFTVSLMLASGWVSAAQLFPLADVRLTASPFLKAQTNNLHYLMALDPDKLLAPFRREAGLPVPVTSYGNWESSGLDGHMGGHYLSALALMYASTGDTQVLERLSYFVAELKKCQQAQQTGYLGGIPGGADAWQAIANGKLKADNFSVNGKWVPWYNLHKTYAGLRDAYRYAGNQDARQMLIALADWAGQLATHLDQEQMQTMLRSEHGGMNEVFADVAEMTGDKKYLDLAIRFSHQAILQPLLRKEDKLNGLHANTQIPKVIGFKRIGDLSGQQDWQQAAAFFWQVVHDHRTVAIGGNSVKEHFHDDKNFSSMINEVEGPETCNTYNMLKLTELLFLSDPKASYSDYYERALYNHILSSQHPDTGGLVYFTPMRPNHYRVYSQVDQAMWCCVGSGIESHAKYGEFIYAHDADSLYVNLFIPSTLNWREKKVELTQSTDFPDQGRTRIVIQKGQDFTLKIRYPAWVVAGKLELRVNHLPVRVTAAPGSYIDIRRTWKKGDQVDISLPMTTTLERMPDASNYYAILHGPIVLAAKTSLFANENLNFFADDSRMGHIAKGPVCPLEAAPVLVDDVDNFMRKIKPIKGKPLQFTAPVMMPGQGEEGARGVQGVQDVTLLPFFRLHEARYTIYWPQTSVENFANRRSEAAAAEAGRLALDAQTIDQVAPGEQQPESDHFFKAEGADAGIHLGRHWRHASGWFSYELNDKDGKAGSLRLSFARTDAGRKFDIYINDHLLKTLVLTADHAEDVYDLDIPIAADIVAKSAGKLTVRFVAQPGSIAGGLYGLRLLRK
ncbi:beta-L-arabinofuranosidase domain-containing protein [Undibacterium sp. Ji50W]|uniref:beta-L-arabinofuranosidase domain-containing protein n=1 Tax=Undibacterium sp. Ji50W TaxID=3413041 RepID=UPI003BF2B4BE